MTSRRLSAALRGNGPFAAVAIPGIGGNGGGMQYVVCYDIADDRRRNRISTLLLDFGSRVQESVFVAHLDEELAGRMRERLRGAVDVDWDKIHVFVIVRGLRRADDWIGQGEVVHDPDWYIV